jgi:hypothetical protein
MTDLWNSNSDRPWRAALDRYDDVVAAQDVSRLVELDRWYHGELPALVRARTPRHVMLDELAQLTEWKMKRGEWRARNLVLVKGNTPDEVVSTSTAALAAIPHPTKPISTLATLHGVGPATASAVAAAVAPDTYPFFDELVAAQVPALGEVKWTLGYYGKYAAQLRARAAALGGDWTAAMVERALWANSGGKAARSTAAHA